ncbi:response regulator transcription factor [Melioribacter sp. OK-6-Me]|uniref:response regulator transcription factor n=1 Tax=unclassified Melioribacter TaxID=2627329 RepID=UPI003EDAF7DD
MTQSEELKGKRILLIEDEESLAIGLEFNLREEGYIVDWAKNGREGIEKITNENYDLIIIDLMLPYHDGFEITKLIRNKDIQMPILILTARSSAEDKIRGFNYGADDYVVKPFNLKELLLRIERMLKRKSWYKNLEKTGETFQFGNNKVNFINLECTSGKKKFRLTPKEAMLLKYFVENRSRIISRKELLENVWNLHSDVETRTVDIFVSRLRRYFELDPDNPAYFKSVRGMGYIFEFH